MVKPRKDTKADHIPPDLEAEIMELAPGIVARLEVRKAQLDAMVWLYEMRRAKA